MIIQARPTQTDIFTSVRSFLVDILPTGTSVVQGQINRVAEPSVGDFAVMWLTGQTRVATNIDTVVDSVFTGSIAGTLLTITDVDARFTQPLAIGSAILADGVAVDTVITALVTGSGGVGTYRVTPSQTLSSRTIAAGQATVEHSSEVMVQIDVHGRQSADNVGRIFTLYHDEQATSRFAAYNDLIAPLYMSDPVQIPFINGEGQVESRWVMEAHLNVNYVYTLPQEFMDEIIVDLLSVDAEYPS